MNYSFSTLDILPSTTSLPQDTAKSGTTVPSVVHVTSTLTTRIVPSPIEIHPSGVIHAYVVRPVELSPSFEILEYPYFPI